MSTDFENELRDLLREKSQEAPLATPAMPASAPQQVLRRGRRHQVGTVLGSAVVVIALIMGSVAGLTRILGDGQTDRDSGDGGYEVFTRTATVEAFTVGSPSDWFLVNEWPLSMVIAVEGSAGAASACAAVPGDVAQSCEDTPADAETSSPIPVPYGLPMLQLSNVDLGLARNACADGLPATGAALYVALDYDAAIEGIADPSIPEFPPGTGLPPEGDGPCGPGRYASFTVNGERFFSWIGLGPDVSDDDRGTVETSYETMSAIPDWTPNPPSSTTPGYVIAGGTSEGGDTWRLELRPGAPDAVMTLDRSGGAAVSTPLDEVLSGSSYEPELTDPIFGAIAKAATGVEFRPGTETTSLDLGQTPVEGTIVPVPPTMSAFDVDLFFIDPPEGYADLGGHVIALGLEGSLVEPPVSPPSVAEARTPVVTLRDTFDGHAWETRFRGDFEDGTACIDVTIDGNADTTDPSCRSRPATSWAGAQPSLDVWLFEEMYIGAGSVSSDVTGVRFRSDDLTRAVVSGTCVSGPIGWTHHNVCAIALPTEDSGVFEYVDDAGVVIFDEAAGWGAADPPGSQPTPVEPVHGHSYWAAYVWVGEARTAEANQAIASLANDFGIQAFQGELGCDDGAAEALPPGSTWGVAVYFATGADASRFADEYRSRNPGSDPVVAHVTTYCLD